MTNTMDIVRSARIGRNNQGQCFNYMYQLQQANYVQGNTLFSKSSENILVTWT